MKIERVNRFLNGIFESGSTFDDARSGVNTFVLDIGCVGEDSE